ncbi:unnamed protein product [Brassica oleracea]
MATRMWKLVTNILILMLQFLVPRVERVLFYLVFSSIVRLGPGPALKYMPKFLRAGPSLDSNGFCSFFFPAGPVRLTP